MKTQLTKKKSWKWKILTPGKQKGDMVWRYEKKKKWVERQSLGRGASCRSKGTSSLLTSKFRHIVHQARSRKTENGENLFGYQLKTLIRSTNLIKSSRDKQVFFFLLKN
jgi:hypothetical protein